MQLLLGNEVCEELFMFDTRCWTQMQTSWQNKVMSFLTEEISVNTLEGKTTILDLTKLDKKKR